MLTLYQELYRTPRSSEPSKHDRVLDQMETFDGTLVVSTTGLKAGGKLSGLDGRATNFILYHTIQ